MQIVAYRLINTLNDSEYESTEAHLAKSLLDILEELPMLPIDQVAERCHVSKSTISKFVNYLGFSDYRDFRENAKNEGKKSAYHNYEEKLSMDRCIERYGNQKYLRIIRQDVEEIQNMVDQKQIHALAEAIYQHKNIAAFGSVYSETVAIDFMYQMAEEGKYIKTNVYDMKQRQFIIQATEEDLIIIFSNSGQYIFEEGMRPYDMSQSYVRKTKAKLALVTSNKAAALNGCVNYPVLYQFTSIVQNHPIISRIVVQMIVDEYKKIANKNK